AMGGAGGAPGYPGPDRPGPAAYLPRSTSATSAQGIVRGCLAPASMMTTLVPGSRETTVPRTSPPFFKATSSAPMLVGAASSARTNDPTDIPATTVSRAAARRRVRVRIGRLLVPVE